MATNALTSLHLGLNYGLVHGLSYLEVALEPALLLCCDLELNLESSNLVLDRLHLFASI